MNSTAHKNNSLVKYLLLFFVVYAFIEFAYVFAAAALLISQETYMHLNILQIIDLIVCNIVASLFIRHYMQKKGDIHFGIIKCIVTAVLLTIPYYAILSGVDTYVNNVLVLITEDPNTRTLILLLFRALLPILLMIPLVIATWKTVSKQWKDALIMTKSSYAALACVTILFTAIVIITFSSADTTKGLQGYLDGWIIMAAKGIGLGIGIYLVINSILTHEKIKIEQSEPINKVLSNQLNVKQTVKHISGLFVASLMIECILTFLYVQLSLIFTDVMVFTNQYLPLPFVLTACILLLNFLYLRSMGMRSLADSPWKGWAIASLAILVISYLHHLHIMFPLALLLPILNMNIYMEAILLSYEYFALLYLGTVLLFQVIIRKGDNGGRGKLIPIHLLMLLGAVILQTVTTQYSIIDYNLSEFNMSLMGLVDMSSMTGSIVILIPEVLLLSFSVYLASRYTLYSSRKRKSAIPLTDNETQIERESFELISYAGDAYVAFVQQEAVKMGKYFIFESGQGRAGEVERDGLQPKDLSGWLIDLHEYNPNETSYENCNIKAYKTKKYVLAQWSKTEDDSLNITFDSF